MHEFASSVPTCRPRASRTAHAGALGVLALGMIVISARSSGQTSGSAKPSDIAPAPTPVASPSPAVVPPTLPVGATVQVAAVTGSPAPPSLSLQFSSPDLLSPTSLAAQPQAATITLSYSTACADAQVLVAPLDGGAINGAGAQTITIAADGTLTFTFQAPSSPGRYHVVTSLNGAQVTLPFDVASPATVTATPVPPATPD